MQGALNLLYPHQCLTCDEIVDSAHGLCGACWGETPFVDGLVCSDCGAPLPGEDDADVRCDDCLRTARPWAEGRTAMLYSGNGRRLVLRLKHGDRPELAHPAAGWMRRAAGGMLGSEALIVPVPAHWRRLLQRRYNQAALLAQALARESGLRSVPDALVRLRRTKVQDGMSVPARFENLSGAIRPHPRRGSVLEGRRVVLVDDVMTSGATLAAATEACRRAGASRVSVLTLARVVKDG